MGSQLEVSCADANGINLLSAMSCSVFVAFTTLVYFPDNHLFYIPGTAV